MKKQLNGWVSAAGLITLLFAQTAPVSAQEDGGSHYIPNDYRPLQLKSGNVAQTGKQRPIGKSGHAHSRTSSEKVLVCPVTGDKIASASDAAGKSSYKGKTYYFCCAGCKPRFDKAPAKFAVNAAKGKFEKM